MSTPTLTKPEARPGFERRTFALADVEVRDANDDGSIPFTGHAAVFESRTWIGGPMWGFHEQVARGAFNRSINGGADVRFLINHNPDLVLARNTAGTLLLAEDEVGLRADANLAPTSYGKDLAISLSRRDVTQMSFAFEVVREEAETLDDGTELRTILEAKLWDVSAVTYPAYDDTEASLRGVGFDVFCHRIGIDTRNRARLVMALADESLPIDPELAPILRQASRTLASLAPDPDPATATPAEGDEVHDPAPSTRGVPLSVLRLRHDRKAKDRSIS